MSALIERIGDSYNEVPYESHAFPQTAPEHLHAIAHLFGLSSPPPATARVLELGCAAGGNLIPFAARNPGAMALGVDLSNVQIDIGQRAIEAMGLGHIELRHMSISDIGPELGTFDYIICHGVYSWVPEDVREAILRVSRENLSPQGIAYISYNVYPGWKAKEIVRDAMMLRAQPHMNSQEKLRYARGMIDFLHDMAQEGSLLKKVMQENIQLIREGHPSYLVHEYLELCNEPCYFRDFAAKAAGHGLAYLAESVTAGMFASNYDSNAATPLLAECGGSQTVLEQLLDFLTNRTFRQTLLVHAERAAEIDYQIDLPRLSGYHLAGSFAPVKDQPNRWESATGSQFSAQLPVQNAIVERLNASWPDTVSASALTDAVAELLKVDRKTVGDQVLAFVQQLVILNAVKVRLAPVTSVPTFQERPFANKSLRELAALKQSAGLPISLFNAWHESVAAEGVIEAALWPLLDGKHDRAALAAALLQLARQGELHFIREGETLTDLPLMEEAAAEHTEAALARLRQLGLLTMEA